MKMLYKEQVIKDRVQELAENIARQYSGDELVHVVVTLNGAFMFAADLIRQLPFPMVLHFTGGSFFEGAIKHDVSINPETLPSNFNNAPVLIVEDVLDSGKSVKQLRQILADRRAGNIQVATLFKRIGGEAEAEYCGFSLRKELFVVGYGMDMDGRYREKRDVYTFETTLMSGEVGRC